MFEKSIKISTSLEKPLNQFRFDVISLHYVKLFFFYAAYFETGQTN